MDPNTVIVVLALNLVFSGGLFRLIARKMPPNSGMRLFGNGGITFGVAYAVRVFAGVDGPPILSALTDTTMVLGALLFTTGVRQFLGQAEISARLMTLVLALYVGAFAIALSRWGMVGRHVLLNVGLGLVYAVLTVEAARGMRNAATSAVRSALLMLVLLVGLLSAMTVLRGLVIAYQGAGAITGGLAAKLYYAYASVAVMLMVPNLLWMVFLRLNRQLADLASRDALTRTLNRNGLDEALRHHFGGRDPQPVCWLLADIDHFKQINDLHGHAAGDCVLREVAAVFTRLVRVQDFVARTGGEEFLIGCVGASAEVAHELGERLREGVAAMHTMAEGVAAPIRCTVSLGVSPPFGRLQEWEGAARHADGALYLAKAAGRNRVGRAA